jgi:RNA-binding protein 15
MISPPPAGSRRTRYSRSPSGGDVPTSKRSKPSNSSDPYDRDHGSKSDQHRLYTSICVKNINPKISDSEIRDLCNKKFSKYGTNSVKIYHRNQERVAFVNFTNCEDARKARHAKTGLVWENMQVLLEPVYYRKTVPAEQPIKSSTPSRERSPPPPRRQRRPSPSPSPPPVSSRSRSHHQSSSRHQYANSPPRSTRPPRRPYSPYIPLPPDLVDYTSKSSSRQRQRSSPSPVRRHQHKQKHSRSPNNHRSPLSSPVPHRSNVDHESNDQQEPTRTILVGNLERDITESKLKELFARYGTIEEIDLKKPSSKRAYAFIQYENMDMAYAARRGMNGQLIGKAECKIGYGKIVPSKYLWVGNIPDDIKRRDLEHAFARYGSIKTLDYSTGDPTAIVTYIDIEDAIKARSKLIGTIQILGGRIIRTKSDSSYRDGFRIDYLDHPTSRRFVIVRPQQKSPHRHESRSSSSSSSSAAASHSRHSSSASSTQHRTPSPSNDLHHDEPLENNLTEEVKTETHSRSPTPPISNPIKQRRSTDHSETSSLNPPVAGRTFYSPLGSYLSSKDTANITNINELMILCEQLNSSATKNNTALSTVYPVQFILKSHAYDARMHFLAGSPTLASLLLGQPGDLVAAKTELKITQRLRLDQYKLDDLERKLHMNVTNALAMFGNNSQMNFNGSISNSNRKQMTIHNQTRFALLLALPKIQMTNGTSKSIQPIKNEISSPNGIEEIKKENIDEESVQEDEPALSRLISYLNEKQAAGVISIPFYPTYCTDHSSRQETAVVHIFSSSEFTKKLLKLICPSINFSITSHDEHLMVVIVHND